MYDLYITDAWNINNNDSDVTSSRWWSIYQYRWWCWWFVCKNGRDDLCRVTIDTLDI